MREGSRLSAYGAVTLDALAAATQTKSTMAPDGAAEDATNERLVPIDHAAIIDGFRELDAFGHYRTFRVSCSACPTVVTVTPEMQQHLLEVARIPFKMLRRGAVRCAPCAATRRRYKWLKRHDRWREVSGGQEELAQLEAAERAARTHGGSEATVQDWPYGTSARSGRP